MRVCEICGDTARIALYTQHFIAPSISGNHQGYTVVCCDRCGFTFADNIPNQTFFDSYYSNERFFQNNEKTARSTHGEVDRRVRFSLDMVVSNTSKSQRILDIGCYDGELLSGLKKRGYKKIVGLEPSGEAVALAKKKYGVDIIQGSLFDTPDLGTFDYIVITHVLEHIERLRDFLFILHRYLKPNGKIYIEVPNAKKYVFYTQSTKKKNVEEPFFQFSLEHINYFTPLSLQQLLVRTGYKKVHMLQYTSSMPVISSVWNRAAILRDSTGENSLKKYIAASELKFDEMNKRINRILKLKKSLYIWGTGQHTQMLLAATSLSKADIIAFIDSEPKLQKAKLLNKMIIAPDKKLLKQDAPIVISTKRFQAEIQAQIRSLNLSNPVILLHDS